MADLKLSQIWIYPVKSLGGISLQTARVMPKGLQYDRRWMLIDDEGQFMTQRVHPEMALFKLTIGDEHIVIDYGQHSIGLSIESPEPGATISAQIWDDTVSVTEVSPAHSEWFSDLLKIKCRLVSFPEHNARAVDPKYAVNDEHVSLADAYPFLIIGQSSLDDLNRKLPQPITMRRFRPNFVFTGGEPHEEDGWRNFTIGSTRFVGVKRCARCAVPTIDPDTAEKGIEPTRTLATYRKRDNKIYFGQNLVAVDHTQVKVGDLITVRNQ